LKAFADWAWRKPAAFEGGGSEGAEAGIFALPPPAGLIVMGNKKSVFYGVFIQKGLARIAEGVIDFAGDAQIVGKACR
jgi:hypothetical protein